MAKKRLRRERDQLILLQEVLGLSFDCGSCGARFEVPEEVRALAEDARCVACGQPVPRHAVVEAWAAFRRAAGVSRRDVRLRVRLYKVLPL